MTSSARVAERKGQKEGDMDMDTRGVLVKFAAQDTFNRVKQGGGSDDEAWLMAAEAARDPGRDVLVKSGAAIGGGLGGVL